MFKNFLTTFYIICLIAITPIIFSACKKNKNVETFYEIKISAINDDGIESNGLKDINKTNEKFLVKKDSSITFEIKLDDEYELGTFKVFSNSNEIQPSATDSQTYSYTINGVSSEINLTFSGATTLKTFSLSTNSSSEDWNSNFLSFKIIEDIGQINHEEFNLSNEDNLKDFYDSFSNNNKNEIPSGTTITYTMYIIGSNYTKIIPSDFISVKDNNENSPEISCKFFKSSNTNTIKTIISFKVEKNLTITFNSSALENIEKFSSSIYLNNEKVNNSIETYTNTPNLTKITKFSDLNSSQSPYLRILINDNSEASSILKNFSTSNYKISINGVEISKNQFSTSMEYETAGSQSKSLFAKINVSVLCDYVDEQGYLLSPNEYKICIYE